MPHDIGSIDPEAASTLAATVRATLDGAPTLETAARRLCGHLRDELRTPTGETACVMARCYATHAYGSLPPDLQRFAKRAYGAVAITPPEPGLGCLVLMASVGDEPEWNDRRASRGHQAIPLPSRHVVEQAPMIAQLVRELGLDIAQVVRHRPGLMMGAPGERSGVFHVEQASGSPYIPAQAEFVARYGIRSVLGFGGAQASGALFAAILFSRVAIPVSVADCFRPLASEIVTLVGGREQRAFDEA